MLTIDEIKIEGEEDGFHLVIYLDETTPTLGNAAKPIDTVRFRIGLPDQFHAETVRTIGRWLTEGEAARAITPSEAFQRAYDITDPKRPDYHDTMSGIHDNREGK